MCSLKYILAKEIDSTIGSEDCVKEVFLEETYNLNKSEPCPFIAQILFNIFTDTKIPVADWSWFWMCSSNKSGNLVTSTPKIGNEDFVDIFIEALTKVIEALPPPKETTRGKDLSYKTKFFQLLECEESKQMFRKVLHKMATLIRGEQREGPRKEVAALLGKYILMLKDLRDEQVVITGKAVEGFRRFENLSMNYFSILEIHAWESAILVVPNNDIKALFKPGKSMTEVELKALGEIPPDQYTIGLPVKQVAPKVAKKKAPENPNPKVHEDSTFADALEEVAKESNARKRKIADNRTAAKTKRGFTKNRKESPEKKKQKRISRVSNKKTLEVNLADSENVEKHPKEPFDDNVVEEVDLISDHETKDEDEDESEKPFDERYPLVHIKSYAEQLEDHVRMDQKRIEDLTAELFTIEAELTREEGELEKIIEDEKATDIAIKGQKTGEIIYAALSNQPVVELSDPLLIENLKKFLEINKGNFLLYHKENSKKVAPPEASSTITTNNPGSSV